MTVPKTDWVVDNALWAAARARLSVLIPFLGDDPAQLARELAAQSSEIEIVLLDDGGKDGDLAARIAETVQALPCPARFLQAVRQPLPAARRPSRRAPGSRG